MDGALMFFGLLWALLGGGRSSSSSSTSSRPWPETSPPSPSPTSSPPWPQVVPPELPPFPGSGWEFDEPPPSAVVQRARALVSQLWARGAGSFKVEQTAGRWIAYQAQIVASGKQGVVAYRLKAARATAQRPQVQPSSAPPQRPQAAPARPPSTPAPQRPQAVPAAPLPRPEAAPRPPVVVTPASSPAPAPASPIALPTLRYGDGLKPQPPNPNVVLLQKRLGFSGADADGRFGEKTRTAVIEFQRRTGLAPNQTNAQLLARGFGVVKEATWTKLFATQQA